MGVPAAILLWAAVDRLSMIRRVQRGPPSRYNDFIALSGGLSRYAGFLFGLHRWVVGAPLLGPAS